MNDLEPCAGILPSPIVMVRQWSETSMEGTAQPVLDTERQKEESQRVTNAVSVGPARGAGQAEGAAHRRLRAAQRERDAAVVDRRRRRQRPRRARRRRRRRRRSEPRGGDEPSIVTVSSSRRRLLAASLEEVMCWMSHRLSSAGVAGGL